MESVRLEAEREAAARQAARQEAERIAARLEAERQETARQAAARQEAARQETERAETARRETERLEAARQSAVRQEAARQEAARQDAARLGAEQDEEAKREARLRAIGRQLDEEAARRDAAATAAGPPSKPLPSSSSARRGRLFGRTDPNVELVLYAEAWARKIELNMTFDLVREAAKRPHTNPLVTVAIRSDGSVESVTFVMSSGVAEIDEAVRRIVESQLPYQPFPPALAREYDVIEIRRTWQFDVAVRLY
jgi:outer membrane biosynthesis protein TonB